MVIVVVALEVSVKVVEVVMTVEPHQDVTINLCILGASRSSGDGRGTTRLYG